jgi:hypothetical protein
MALVASLRKHARATTGVLLAACLCLPAGASAAQTSPLASALPQYTCAPGDFCITSAAAPAALRERVFQTRQPAHPLAACFVASRWWGFPFAWCTSLTPGVATIN